MQACEWLAELGLGRRCPRGAFFWPPSIFSVQASTAPCGILHGVTSASAGCPSLCPPYPRTANRRTLQARPPSATGRCQSPEPHTKLLRPSFGLRTGQTGYVNSVTGLPAALAVAGGSASSSNSIHIMHLRATAGWHLPVCWHRGCRPLRPPACRRIGPGITPFSTHIVPE